MLGDNGGDRTDVTPPAGGTGESTVTDELGRTVALRQYHAGVAAGSSDPAGFDATTYTYDRKDQLRGITDSTGLHWGYDYDLRGRRTQATDPDNGTTTSVYNDADDLTSTTDARGITLGYTYDAIGRRTSLREGSPTGPKRAEWTYDTLSNGTSVNGKLVKSIRYVGTDAYTVEVIGYTPDYQPTSVSYTIPTTETGVSGTYTYVNRYKQDGALATVRLPALGNLGIETVTHGYNPLGQATTLASTLGATYVTGTEYTSLGELGATTLRNNGGNTVGVGLTYETDTRRLAGISTTKQTAPTTVADVRYGHDPAGNVTKTSDLTAGDHQCFRTDNLARLTEAWTPANGDCTVEPTVTGLAASAGAYWQSFTYDPTGNRTRQVEHLTPAGMRTTSYDILSGKHALGGTTTVDGGGTRTATYTYDPAGNTRTRPAAAAGTQTLTWDLEGRLATSTDTTGTTSYVYDADGNRLVRTDPTGKTLYLPGQELRFASGTGSKTATRYYSHGGSTVAMRTGAGVTWLTGDHQNTSQIAIDAVTQAVTIRRQTPFGDIRATNGTWPAAMDKGFVGGTNDNTGLTHLGARGYDPTIGRFVSVDPLLDTADPQQMNGYNYGNNNPVTLSDPGGTEPGSWCNTSNCSLVHDCATQFSVAECGGQGAEDAVNHPLAGKHKKPGKHSYANQVYTIMLSVHNAFNGRKVGYAGSTAQQAMNDVQGQADFECHHGAKDSCKSLNTQTQGPEWDNGNHSNCGKKDMLKCAGLILLTLVNAALQADAMVAGEGAGLGVRGLGARTAARGAATLTNAERNALYLQNWAKAKGWVRKPGKGPETWGVYDENGHFAWRMKIKREGSTTPGLHADSTVPRVSTRLDDGSYINPFTGQIVSKADGDHIPLDKPWLDY